MTKHTIPLAGGAMLTSDDRIAEAFSNTRRLIIAAGNLAEKLVEEVDREAGRAVLALQSVICAAEEKFKIALDWFEDGADNGDWDWEAREEAAERKAAPAGQLADKTPGQLRAEAAALLANAAALESVEAYGRKVQADRADKIN